MSRRAAGALAAGLASLLLLGASRSGVPDAQRLWASPYDGGETIDVDQSVYGSGSHIAITREHSAGQLFAPGRSPLIRLDVRLSNLEDQRPGRIRLWRWRGSRARTVEQVPLFEDRVELSGKVGYRVHSFFPDIGVAAGALHYFELDTLGPNRFAVQHSYDGTDHYARGHLLEAGERPAYREAWDLWFRTWSNPIVPVRAVEPPPSDPKAKWVPPLRARKVTREDYYVRVKQTADYVRHSAKRGCGTNAELLAQAEAFLYRASCERGRCDEAQARLARDLMLKAHAWRFCAAHPPGLPRGPCQKACDPDALVAYDWLKRASIAYLWIRDSPSLDAEAHARIRELLLDNARRAWPIREVGTHNRAMQSALTHAIAARLFPDAPEADEWRRFADSVWSEFWQRVDTREDSSEYASVTWWPAVLQYLEIAGIEDEAWSDPRFLALVERTASMMTPLGSIASYGDGVGWARDSAGLVWLFEKAAARTGEARYRWLAHRTFDFVRRYTRDRPPREESLSQSMAWLEWAWLDADESIEPAPPAQPWGSLVTERHAVRLRPRSDWGERPWRMFDVLDERVPDKLVLRAGHEADGMHAMFNLVSRYGHGQPEVGALVSFVDGGAILLQDTPFPYWFHRSAREDESAALVRRYAGGSLREPVGHASVTRLDEGARVSVAWLEWDDPSGWGARQERRIYFVKNRFMLVRDRVALPDGMSASAGPLWHFGDLARERGPNWFDAYTRVPMSDFWRLRNVERHVLLNFVERPGRRVGGLLEPSYLPPGDCPKSEVRGLVPLRCRAGPPYVLYQRWTGRARGATDVWFDTLLLPHGAEQGPASLAEGVRVLLADETRLALEVAVGDERWTLVDSPGGQPVQVEGLSTDALYAIVGAREGASPALIAADASRLDLGTLSRSWPERGSYREPGDLPRRAAAGAR